MHGEWPKSDPNLTGDKWEWVARDGKLFRLYPAGEMVEADQETLPAYTERSVAGAVGQEED